MLIKGEENPFLLKLDDIDKVITNGPDTIITTLSGEKTVVTFYKDSEKSGAKQNETYGILICLFKYLAPPRIYKDFKKHFRNYSQKRYILAVFDALTAYVGVHGLSLFLMMNDVNLDVS